MPALFLYFMKCYTLIMSLQTDIRESIKNAMREKDQVKLDTLRGVLSACMNEAVATGGTPQTELSDEQVQAVIKRLIKQRKDSISQFEGGGRADLAETEQAQLAVLEAYQPAQMGEADIRAIAEKKKAELNVTDKSKLGILVGAVMKETAGQADGSIVKKIVEELFV
jgi:uncharacterized protein